MTHDIDPSAVRVLYTRPNYLVLGPLGCYYTGQRVVVDGVEHTVTSIDPDGAAVARSDEHIAGLPQGVPESFRSFPCKALADVAANAGLQQLIGDGMLAQQERNRREHGVVLPGEMAKAA